MNVRALIFDFDGLLVNTEPIHMEAFRDVLKAELKVDYSEEEYKQNYLGIADRDVLEKILQLHNIVLDDNKKKNILDKKARICFKKFEKNIPLIDGVKDFIESIKEKYPLAICSGGLKKEIHFILEKLGWLTLFNPIITANDMRWGKPHPQGYVMAYEALGTRQSWRPILQPSECLAIEDSRQGIESAHGAGMPCVAVTNSYESNELKNAEHIVTTLSEIHNLLATN